MPVSFYPPPKVFLCFGCLSSWSEEEFSGLVAYSCAFRLARQFLGGLVDFHLLRDRRNIGSVHGGINAQSVAVGDHLRWTQFYLPTADDSGVAAPLLFLPFFPFLPPVPAK